MSVWPAEPAWSAVGHPLQPPCPVASAPGQAGCGPLSQLMPGLGVHQEPVEVSALEADSAERQPTPCGAPVGSGVFQWPVSRLLWDPRHWSLLGNGVESISPLPDGV